MTYDPNAPAVLRATTTAATSFESPAFDLGDCQCYGVQMLLSGSDVAGTAKLQASLDNETWIDVPSSSQSITGSTDYLWSVSGAGYRYVRISWAYSSGTGNITVKAIVKKTPILGG
jgi:hypothetical protein